MHDNLSGPYDLLSDLAKPTVLRLIGLMMKFRVILDPKHL